MVRNTLATLVICGLTLAAAGCFGDGGTVVPIKEPSADPRDPGPGKTIVYERGPTPIQCAGMTTTLKQSAKKLINAGIAISGSGCAADGFAYPAVCGAMSGEILVHTIPESRLPDAQALGFRSVDELPGWQPMACVHYMHAIEVAQDTPHCANLRNRVLFIQDQTKPEDRFSLLDQAGSCADASYRQVLYGKDGDNVLCSMAETIAGPQKSCPVPGYEAMFDTILANLDRPDLGLGSNYSVGLVYPF